MAEYTEDCCFNYTRDYCRGGDCVCRCHERDTPAESDAETLRQLLMKAASNGHALMGHPPYGSSFLDCTLGPCTDYRTALFKGRAPAPLE